ncbi:MAG: N-acetylmuramoyl-L-alanine amidase [Burkholderiales bacterium]|nr:N-acetylmuramoyl-L-alanine amidase [Burkholderiales bacterium]
MRPITHIVVHCSASPNGRAVSAQEIDAWHRQRGFRRRAPVGQPHLPHIGYHYVIDVDGTVTEGRSLGEIGAHVAGSNARSIGICLIGINRYTPAQWQALQQLHEDLARDYPAAQWLGHRDFSPDQNGDGVIEPWEFIKTCPGFNVAEWIAAGHRPHSQNVLEAS